MMFLWSAPIKKHHHLRRATVPQLMTCEETSIGNMPRILKYTRPRVDQINNLKLMTTISFTRNTDKSITYDVLVFIVTFNQFSATLQLANLWRMKSSDRYNQRTKWTPPPSDLQ